MLPLYFSLSSRRLRLITSLGTGVLVGTALIVIIPEGIDTLYNASGSMHSHGERSVSLATRTAAVEETFPASLKHDVWRRGISALPEYNSDGYAYNSYDTPNVDSDSGSDLNVGKITTEQDEERTDPTHDNDLQPKPSYDPHAWVGLALITGFILMYLIDTLPSQLTRPSQPQRFHISLNQFSLHRSDSAASELPAPPNAPELSSNQPSRPSSTTIGLVIHAVADGIALGASSTASTKRLSFIIFFALMIHKAPAAFGLSAVLLKQGLSKRMARAHLIVFSLAAPIGAIVMFFVVNIFSSPTSLAERSSEFATGVVLLFSAGTFLYVAMHTMNESGDAHERTHIEGGVNGYGYASVPMADLYDSEGLGANGVSSIPKAEKKTGLAETGVCVLGMLLPLVFQVGHVH